ncbi:Hypothetical predicted protein [Pelobates cultripes]|uniref:Uncharacterized protein n=1 Tax=Pelobates cultripes TaxID=61616 RepID=A0AAD1WI97_PELCU|nr:Hypothetical predicted protein [Pelobates cultripes]
MSRAKTPAPRAKENAKLWTHTKDDLQMLPAALFMSHLPIQLAVHVTRRYTQLKRQTEEAVTWTTKVLLADKSTSKTSHHSAYKGPPNDSCFRIIPTLGNSNNSQIP